MPVPLATLSPEELSRVVLHPVQRGVHPVICELIGQLRTCDTPDDYQDYQRALFQVVHAAETARADVRRVVKRLKRGQGVPSDAPELPTGADISDPDSWRLEELTRERVVRQLRSVGDGLAWRVTGFDRRFILALSRNAQAGPMAGKAGLPFELGAVAEMWEQRGHFALLHDLTSCLRIGDITEFTTDGRRLLHEVKAQGKRTGPQLQRMETAVRAVNEGGPLPGSTERLLQVETPLATDLHLLEVALDLADSRGVAGVKAPGGRALVAGNALTLARSGSNPDAAVARWNSSRQRALRRAGIDSHRHHLTMRTADWAARNPVAVPYAVYPLPPSHCADLICDFSIVELVASIDGILEAAQRRGLMGETLLPDAHGELTGDQSLFRLSATSGRSVVVHTGVVNQLLAELVTVDSFLDALDVLLAHPDPPSNPIVVYRNETAVWR